MNLVNYLAEIFGILLVVLPLAMLINQKYLKTLLQAVKDDKTSFCLGITALVIGLSMVLAYNVWEKSWQVVITIIGWLILLKGLALLFLPEFVRKWVSKVENASFVPYALIIAVFIGLIITYLGFTA